MAMQQNILKIKTPVGKYYVYTLARPDGTVFYVGKGKKNRVNQHEIEASTHCGCPKCCVIRSIWAAGETIVKAIVFQTDAEHEALDYERSMILANRANLCNRTDGCVGKTQRYQIDRPRRHSWELYDAMYQECLQEIKDIEQRVRQSTGHERIILRDEIRQKKELLSDWHQRSMQARKEVRALFKEMGRVDRIRRRPTKPW